MEELQRLHSESKFAASSAKAEAEATKEINNSLRRRIETLSSDLHELREKLQTQMHKEVSFEDNSRLQGDLLAEQARVRELEQAIDQMKVMPPFHSCCPSFHLSLNTNGISLVFNLI